MKAIWKVKIVCTTMFLVALSVSSCSKKDGGSADGSGGGGGGGGGGKPSVQPTGSPFPTSSPAPQDPAFSKTHQAGELSAGREKNESPLLVIGNGFAGGTHDSRAVVSGNLKLQGVFYSGSN